MTPVASLYLIVEPGHSIETCLPPILSYGSVAAVLIVGSGRELAASSEVGQIVEVARQEGVVALIQGDASLALKYGADGIHIDGGESAVAAYRNARDLLGRQSVIGASANDSRHSAMVLGEAGADYVCFGADTSQQDHHTGKKQAKCRRNSLVSWWAELFEIPCVAFDVDTPEEAGDLARAGADFISCRLKRDANLEAHVAQINKFSTALQLAIGEGT